MSDTFILHKKCGQQVEDGFPTIVRLRYWCPYCEIYLSEDEVNEKLIEYFKGEEDEENNKGNRS